MSQKISGLPTADVVGTTALRKVFTGYVSEDGEQLLSEDWPIASITYTAGGDVDVVTYTGPTGAWTYTPHYSGSDVDYITITDPASNAWRQTLTYTDGIITAQSAWVKL